MPQAIVGNLGTLMVGGLTMVSVLAIVIAMRPRRDPVSERLGDLAQVEALEPEMARPFWQRAVVPFLRSILHFFGRISPKGNTERQRQLILVAGSPGRLSVVDLMGAKLLLAGLGLGIALLGVSRAPAIGLREVLVIVALPLLCYQLPTLWLRRRVRSRRHEIERALPDALDMLTICVESGLGIEAAMLRLSDQWDNELTREMRRAVREMRMGISRSEALRHMVQRTAVPALSTFVAVIIQAEQLGVSIANVLRTQSDQMRVVRWQRAQERGRSAPVKMVFAMVLLVMPSLFIVVLAPAIPRFALIFSSFNR